MISGFKYLLINFYDNGNHVSGLYKKIEDIASEININRATIYHNYDQKNDYYSIYKNNQLYIIKKI